MKTHGMRGMQGCSLRVLGVVVVVALLLISSMPLGSVSAAALPLLSLAQARQSPATFDCSTVTEIPLAECQALVALYNSANGSSWANHTNWLSTTTPCSWYGVTCDTGSPRHVSLLGLSLNQLSGALPPELGQLANLQDLILSANQLTGSIPPALGQLASLQSLYLQSNRLSGAIPPELSRLTNLQKLDLSLNWLTGSIPPELGQLANLLSLDLHYNQLTGSIPPELGQLANLQSLDLSLNWLSGSIPPELGQLTNLQDLILTSDQLTGSIPPALGQLASLQSLYLQSNRLSGPLPLSLANLSMLEAFGFDTARHCVPSDAAFQQWFTHRHQFTDAQTCPVDCSQVSEIQLAECQALVAVYTSTKGSGWTYQSGWSGGSGNNTPCGWYGVTCDTGSPRHVSRLMLTANQLTGSMPPELGQLASLRDLDLHSNQLSGSIPQELGQLGNLQYLELSSNPLSGPLPLGLTDLGQLTYFHFEATRLCVPPDAAFQAWLGGVPNKTTGAPTCKFYYFPALQW